MFDMNIIATCSYIYTKLTQKYIKYRICTAFETVYIIMYTYMY